MCDDFWVKTLGVWLPPRMRNRGKWGLEVSEFPTKDVVNLVVAPGMEPAKGRPIAKVPTDHLAQISLDSRYCWWKKSCTSWKGISVGSPQVDWNDVKSIVQPISILRHNSFFWGTVMKTTTTTLRKFLFNILWYQHRFPLVNIVPLMFGGNLCGEMLLESTEPTYTSYIYIYALCHRSLSLHLVKYGKIK